MLKFEINKKDMRTTLEEIKISNICSNKDDMLDIECAHNHNLLPSDNVFFIKKCGETEIYRQSKQPILDNDRFNFFSINRFEDYGINPNRIVEVKGLKENPFSEDENTNDYLCFVFENGEEHDFYECKDIVIKENLYPQEDYDDILNNKMKRRCPNDYVIYNKVFLYKAGEKTTNTFYDIEKENFLNTKGDIYFIKNDGTHIDLKNCIVPVLNNGNDNRHLLYWKITEDKKEIAEYIKENFQIIQFYCKDTRFLDESLSLKKNVQVYKEIGNIKINIPFEEQFETNMLQYEHYNEDYIEGIKDENVNPIVDMEKQIFFPQHDDIIIKKIIFNLHFRKRGAGDTIEEIDKGWKENNIQNEWWQNDEEIENNSSDLLGYLGFTDSDVYYQKTKLKKSFLRLSFYDSKDRLTQNLLYYATIFIDGGVQYGRYCKNIAEHNDYFDDGKNVMVLDGKGVTNTLNSQIVISDNYDNTACSEGYFLYLFPDGLEIEKERPIYMKVEFNHAKYGVTIPLMKNKNPEGYITKENNDTKGISNMLSDLYSEVALKYLDEKKYTWDVSKNGNFDETTGILMLNLYEPIIYKI